MTDNPFDETAVEAAAKAYLRAKNNITTDAAWEVTMPGLKQTALNFQTVALTAACKSMKERGRARTIPNFVLLDGLKPDTATVTIFRHGE